MRVKKPHKDLYRGTTLERSAETLLRDLKQFYTRETSLLKEKAVLLKNVPTMQELDKLRSLMQTRSKSEDK